jgi:hypothetical protein
MDSHKFVHAQGDEELSNEIMDNAHGRGMLGIQMEECVRMIHP